jgi:hypothetical protein
MLERDCFNEKTRIGPATGFLRKPLKSMEKHLPLKVKDCDDYSRITKSVAKEASASLREGFDANVFLNPTWKEVKKDRWKTTHGMSYSGQASAHVANQKTKLFGASKKAEASMIANI